MAVLERVLVLEMEGCGSSTCGTRRHLALLLGQVVYILPTVGTGGCTVVERSVVAMASP